MGKMEDSMKRLEEISSLLDQGDVDFDQSMALYKEGMSLIAACKKSIDKAEKEIEEMKSC